MKRISGLILFTAFGLGLGSFLTEGWAGRIGDNSRQANMARKKGYVRELAPGEEPVATWGQTPKRARCDEKLNAGRRVSRGTIELPVFRCQNFQLNTKADLEKGRDVFGRPTVNPPGVTQDPRLVGKNPPKPLANPPRE